MARKKSEGLGDTIEKVAKATGVKKLIEIFVDGQDCGCDERKQKLNVLFAYKLKARCLTEIEYNEWKEFMEVRSIRLSAEQVKYVCELYASIFNRQIYVPCSGCSPAPLISMIDKLDKVYNQY